MTDSRRLPSFRATATLALLACLSMAALPSFGAVLAGAPVDPLAAEKAQLQSNLDLAHRLLPLARSGTLEDAVEAAKLATRWQAETLGEPWQPAEPGASHALPSEALRELAAGHGLVPTPEQEAGLQGLDQLEPAPRLALARLVDRFIDFQAAAVAMRDAADLGALPDPSALTAGAASGAGGLPLQQALAAANLHPGRLLAARNALLDASLALRDALAHAASHDSDVAMPPVFSIDISDGSVLHFPDNTYGPGNVFMLLVDVGGDDTYLNNAGGNNLDAGASCGNGRGGITVNAPAAALIDLASAAAPGNDVYGSADALRKCGIDGGGVQAGAGFLFDDGGDETYVTGVAGVNGGGDTAGYGFLLDGGGRDAYDTGGGGANGGGQFYGAGLLLDAGDADERYGNAPGANAGGQNGGGAFGLGFLLDGGGNESYSDADGFGGNGGGRVGSVGFLLDASGDDDYESLDGGVNGGASDQSVGFLFDAGAGDDRYVAGDCATNGAGGRFTTPIVCLPAVGMLFDGGGVDHYEDGLGTCDNAVTASCTILVKELVGFQIDAS